MRKLLDGLYGATAAIAAVFMVGLLVMVLLSILGRQLHFHLPVGALLHVGGEAFEELGHVVRRRHLVGDAHHHGLRCGDARDREGGEGGDETGHR